MGYSVEEDLEHLIKEMQRLNEGTPDEIKACFGCFLQLSQRSSYIGNSQRCPFERLLPVLSLW